MARREKTFTEGDEEWSGISVTVTRKGMEVIGWYDGSHDYLEGPTLTWEELLAAKAEVEKAMPRENGKAV